MDNVVAFHKHTNPIVCDAEDGVFHLLAGIQVEGSEEPVKDFTVREMTGADEEAITKGDVATNGGKIIRTILERCVLSVGDLKKSSMQPLEWRAFIQSILCGDQDAMYLAIRYVTFGKDSDFNMTTKCPDCGAEIHTSFDVDELTLKPFSGEFKIPFELPKGFKDPKTGEIYKQGYLRQPNGADREALASLAKKNMGEANTKMLCRLICDVPIHVSEDMLRSASLADRTYLFDLIVEHTFGLNNEQDITCEKCGNEFRAVMKVENFI